MIVTDLLTLGVSRSPERPCVVEGERSHSFAETSERAARLAAALRGLRVGRGDRVALLAQNELSTPRSRWARTARARSSRP